MAGFVNSHGYHHGCNRSFIKMCQKCLSSRGCSPINSLRNKPSLKHQEQLDLCKSSQAPIEQIEFPARREKFPSCQDPPRSSASLSSGWFGTSGPLWYSPNKCHSLFSLCCALCGFPVFCLLSLSSVGCSLGLPWYLQLLVQ